jgi:hypothetical protein
MAWAADSIVLPESRMQTVEQKLKNVKQNATKTLTSLWQTAQNGGSGQLEICMIEIATR